MTMHIGEAEIPTLGAIGELGVIKTEQMKNRRMKIVDVDFIFDRIETEFIGLTHFNSTFHATARHPHGEGVRVVIATVVATLQHRRATELAAPDDERII